MSNTITKQLPNRAEAKLAKTDSRYWLARIFKPVNDRGEASPHYAMQLMFKGRRMAFGLRTANGEAAARRARDIYSDLLTLGVVATLAKHRTHKPAPSEGIPTVGEWIAAAQKVFDKRAATFGSYARCLRRIAGDILAVEKTRSRFSPVNSASYRKKIDAASLEILTPKAIQAWRIDFLSGAKGNPAKQRSAKTTANSTMRNARGLFSRKIVKFIAGANVPSPLPFAGCEFYGRQDMRYESKISPSALLQKAQTDLAVKDGEAFKALLLALAAGLRRGEIDALLWRNVDFTSGTVRVEATEEGELKSEDSSGLVPIDETTVALLRGFHAKAGDCKFVLVGGHTGAASRLWGHRYRCDEVFTRLNAWLRANGGDSAKPLHTLRKEAGSIIATQSGIYAASRFLRHADIQVTAQHYVSHKERVTIGIGAFLRPANVTEMKPRKERKPQTAAQTQGAKYAGN